MKAIVRYISIFVVLLMLPAFSYSQCEIYADFNTYQAQGMSSTIEWTPLTSNSVICYSSDWQPSFFVNSDTLLNVKISGDLYVNSSVNDDDFVGFVFGYSSPNITTLSNDNHFYLFDWKKVGQHAPDEFGGLLAQEGFTLSRADGVINNDPVTTYKYFWAHESGVQFTTLDSKYGNDIGWEYNTSYHFELVYTYNRILISINGEKIFDENGCFPPGFFGLYSFNQNGVNYSNLKIEQHYNIQLDSDQENFCEERPVYLSFIDTACTQIPQSLGNYEWNFGDDSPNSSDLLPHHVYDDPGSYEVQLYVTDMNGCVDTIAKDVFIEPKPEIIQQPINDSCFVGDGISFSVMANYAEDYQWYYQANGMSYWSKVKNNGYFTGATTAELHVYNVRPQFDKMKFRCQMDGVCFNPVTSQYGEIFITDVPLRAELNPAKPAICNADSTYLLINLKELYQMKYGHLRILYDTNTLRIGNVTTYFQSMSFDIQQLDNYLDIGIAVSEPINIEEAIVASVNLTAIGSQSDTTLLSWDIDHTYFVSETSDTIIKILRDSYLVVNQAYVVNLNDTIQMCRGDRLNIDEQQFGSVLWSTGSEEPSIVVNNDGEYWVHLVDRNACASTDTFYCALEDVPKPPLDIIPDKPFYCTFDDTVSFTIEGGEGDVFKYSYENHFALDSNYSTMNYHIQNPGGSFSIIGQWVNLCGSSAPFTKNVDVFEAADAKVSLLTNHTSVQLGEQLSLTAIPQDGGDQPYYIWKVNGYSEQSGFDNIFVTDHVKQNQEYSVTMYSNKLCQLHTNIAKASLVLNLDNGPDLYVPGLVTPNGDGVNDAFKVVFREAVIYHFRLQIYDMSGRLVFETSDLHQAWDGRQILGEGIAQVFAYRIQYSEVFKPEGDQLKQARGKFIFRR